VLLEGNLERGRRDLWQVTKGWHAAGRHSIILLFLQGLLLIILTHYCEYIMSYIFQFFT